MAAELKSTLIGMVTGFLANVVFKDVIIAIAVAGLTGAASYVGHAAMKHIHERYFKRKKKRS